MVSPRFSLVPFAVLLLGSLLWAACSAPEAGTRARADRAADVITSEQIGEFLSIQPAASAYDLVRQFRPNWLARRSPTSQVWVYEGGMRVGEASRYLRGVSASDVERIEYLTPNIATARLGIGHEEGAIILHYRF